MHVVEKLTAHFQIQFAPNLRASLLDVLRLHLNVLVPIETNAIHHGPLFNHISRHFFETIEINGVFPRANHMLLLVIYPTIEDHHGRLLIKKSENP